MSTVRLTVGQAIIRFLVNQYTERDGVERRLIAGAFGIFGHGNVAGIGQALLQNDLDPTPEGERMRYIMPRNEQGMVHAAAAYAKTTNRLSTWMCTSSIGPGSLNMVTGAALATTNRLPVLLFPSDQFATRFPDPVLQQVEDPVSPMTAATDCFRPVSRFFDRIERPEQLIPSLLAGLRVLTDPVDTGAVTIALPQDVQAESYDFPVEFFARRVWHVRRPPAEAAAIERAAAIIRDARKPLVVAGGGVIYAEASTQLRAFADATGIPVSDTQAGKGAINHDHPAAVGGVGSTGAASANALADEADVVIGIGTRYSDFTTASHTQFKNPDVKFININVAAFDAAKHSAEMVVGDARESLEALTAALDGYRVGDDYTERIAGLKAEWAKATHECYHRDQTPLPAQTEVFGALNELMGDRDVVINAAGSMPGDLQCLWQAPTPEQYHVEYAFSCMGYEIPAAMGVKLARPEAEVVSIVGDGTYQMLPMELATIVYGFASIGALSESHGSQRFGTRYRTGETPHNADGDLLPVDIAANAESWGLKVLRVHGMEEFRRAYAEAVVCEGPVMIHIETDLYGPNPPGSSWWDVPISEVSRLESTQQARTWYEGKKTDQRHYLR